MRYEFTYYENLPKKKIHNNSYVQLNIMKYAKYNTWNVTYQKIPKIKFKF